MKRAIKILMMMVVGAIEMSHKKKKTTGNLLPIKENQLRQDLSRKDKPDRRSLLNCEKEKLFFFFVVVCFSSSGRDNSLFQTLHYKTKKKKKQKFGKKSSSP